VDVVRPAKRTIDGLEPRRGDHVNVAALRTEHRQFLATELGGDAMWHTQSVSAKEARTDLEAFHAGAGPIVQKGETATNRSEPTRTEH
jgi:hypothetical protein